jgi:hypothetical protein
VTGTYTRYTVEDAEGADQLAVWEQDEYTDARDLAARIGGKVIAQEYTWSDSELVDDFTASDDDDEATP